MLKRSITPGRTRRGARIAAAVATFGLLASVSGCGLLGGSDEESPAAGGDGSVETPNLTVSTLPAIDVAPLHMAVNEGYFEEEGLNVTIEQTGSGQAALTKLIGGDSHIAFSSYVPFLVAQDKGAADIKFVADSVATTPDSFVLVTMPDSSVESVEDLEHKRIAVSDLNTISDAMVKSVMKSNGLDHETVEWVPTPFPDIAGALSRGDVDAGLLIEPFLTDAESSTGTVPVIDVATGPTKDFPLAGYGALAEFVEENPQTIAAFQRAMSKATDEAQDRSKVEPIAVEEANVEPDIAKLLKLPEFRSALDASRIQRVSDLLSEFDIIKEKIDVSEMIVQPDDL